MRGVAALDIAVRAHPLGGLGKLWLDGGVILPLKLLETLLCNDRFVQR